MKKSRLTESPIVSILKEADGWRSLGAVVFQNKIIIRKP
jgi:hypothetical protein